MLADSVDSDTRHNVEYRIYEISPPPKKKKKQHSEKVVCPGEISWLENLVLFKLKKDMKERGEQKRCEITGSIWNLS